MSDIAIRVENLSKAYRIGLKEQIPDTLVGAMASWMRSPLRNFNNLRRLNTFRANGDAEDIVWALKDVSFDVKDGEVIGIIGRNGAGKSTLLKILSRITDPTSGMATIRGRVSSLLEVGTGFHPELTGRENIYMNGTILGMSKREIDRKFDEIVDFSGVEKFLDTPIKRYSSGMKVRLAFSVAAHLEPQILIIDEVLAVGDQEFQKKCLGTMQHLAAGGRTVLFVSHNMPAVARFCTRAVWLNAGSIKEDGHCSKVVANYKNTALDSSPVHAIETSAEFRLVRAFVSQDLASRDHTAALAADTPFLLRFVCESGLPLEQLLFSIAVVDEAQHSLIWERREGQDVTAETRARTFELCIMTPPLRVRQGCYRLNFMVRRSGTLEKLYHCKGVAPFEIVSPDSPLGLLSVPLSWKVHDVPDT